MKKAKSFYQALQLNIASALILSMSACMPLESRQMSVIQIQKAMDLVDQGTLLMRATRLAEAQGAFAAASEIGSVAAAVDGLGCVAFLRKDFLLAEKYFVQAYEMDKNYKNSLGNLALLYQVNGLSSKAEQIFEMALSAEPENFRTRNNFAVQLMAKNDREGAKLELLKALAIAKHPVVAGNLNKLE